jgi:hypothetical protein
MRTLFGISFLVAFACKAAAVQAQIFVSAAGDDDNSCSRTAPCRTLQRGIDTTGAGREMTTAPVQAQIFISAIGDDDNNCGRAAPCRTLQRGIDATSAGREMTILNAGEYGPGNITKSITILAEGVSANIRSFAAGSDAITIDNPAAEVALKGLFLTGGGTGGTGIRIVDAAAVHIQDCTIERFASGIAANGGTEIFVAGTVSRENSGRGLFVSGLFSAAEKLKVEDSQFENNGDDGLDLQGIDATITRSAFTGNGGDGIEQSFGETDVTWTTATDNAGDAYIVGNGQMTLEFSVARGNGGAGLRTTTSSAIGRISNSVVTDNNIGLANDDGSLFSHRNNTVHGNTPNTQGTITTLNGV